MQQFLDVFEHIKTQNGKAIFDSTQLHCKVGSYGGCAVLKLLKKTWTNDSMDVVPNESGIFFSIWIGEESLRGKRVWYNIHALKMRYLKGYTIKKSSDFCADFRTKFEDHRDAWPNISTHYGMLTLMQGWIALNPASLGTDALQLMNRFVELAPMIDELLATRKASIKQSLRAN